MRTAPPGRAQPHAAGAAPRGARSPRGTCERMFSWLSASSSSGSAEGPAVPAGVVPARQPAPSAARQSSNGSGRAMGGRRRGRGRRGAAAARSGAERRGRAGGPVRAPAPLLLLPSLPVLLPTLCSSLRSSPGPFPFGGGTSPGRGRAPGGTCHLWRRLPTTPVRCLGSAGHSGIARRSRRRRAPVLTSPKGLRCRSAPGEPEHPTLSSARQLGQTESHPYGLSGSFSSSRNSLALTLHPLGHREVVPMAWHSTPRLSVTLPTLGVMQAAHSKTGSQS